MKDHGYLIIKNIKVFLTSLFLDKIRLRSDFLIYDAIQKEGEGVDNVERTKKEMLYHAIVLKIMNNKKKIVESFASFSNRKRKGKMKERKKKKQYKIYKNRLQSVAPCP